MKAPVDVVTRGGQLRLVLRFGRRLLGALLPLRRKA